MFKLNIHFQMLVVKDVGVSVSTHLLFFNVSVSYFNILYSRSFQRLSIYAQHVAQWMNHGLEEALIIRFITTRAVIGAVPGGRFPNFFPIMSRTRPASELEAFIPGNPKHCKPIANKRTFGGLFKRHILMQFHPRN